MQKKNKIPWLSIDIDIIILKVFCLCEGDSVKSFDVSKVNFYHFIKVC